MSGNLFKQSQGEFNYFPKGVKMPLTRLKSCIWHLIIVKSNSTHAITPNLVVEANL